LSEKDIIDSVLKNYRIVAIVGLSKDPAKVSYEVGQFLQSKSYRVIPVNPSADQILGEKNHKSLLEMPEEMQKTVEIVDIFRPSADVPPIVDQAIELKKKYGKPYVVWMQIGIINHEAANKAKEAGFTVIMDRCMMNERRRLDKEEETELEEIRARKMQEMIKMKKEEEASGNSLITLDDANFKDVVQKHTLMLIDCWAAWCGPCRMIAPVIDELAREYSDRLTVGKLNVDENSETAARFGITSIPTLLIIKNGKEAERIIGAVPKPFIEDKLKKYF
jgi:thioredoxin